MTPQEFQQMLANSNNPLVRMAGAAAAGDPTAGGFITPDHQVINTPIVGQSNYGGYDNGAADMSDIGLKGMSGSTSMQNQFLGRDPWEFATSENSDLAQNEANTRNGDQSGALQLARESAMGLAPSAAAYQMQYGLNQAAAQQAAMAGGARGASSLALAQQNAAGNVGNLQQNAFTQAGQLRAQEMAAALGQYGNFAEQQRAQDQARLAQGNQMAQFNASQAQANQLQNSSLANQANNNAQGWYSAAQNPYNQQLQADTARATGQAQAQGNTNALVAQANENQKQRNAQNTANWVGLGGTVIGGAVGGPIGAALVGGASRAAANQATGGGGSPVPTPETPGYSNGQSMNRPYPY